jgi:hypothetical protein
VWGGFARPTRADSSVDQAPEKAQAILQSDGYQTDLPNDAPPGGNEGDADGQGGHGPPLRLHLSPPHGDHWVMPSNVAPPSGADGSLSVAPFAANLAQIIFWVGIGVAIVLVIVLILRSVGVLGGQAVSEDDAVEDEEAEAASAPLAPSDDAEALANAGRYEEATHLLLLHAVEHLRKQTRRDVARSHTSRELCDRLPPDAERRTAFADLVVAVEVSHFGSEPVSRERYLTCLQSYRRLAQVAG